MGADVEIGLREEKGHHPSGFEQAERTFDEKGEAVDARYGRGVVLAGREPLFIRKTRSPGGVADNRREFPAIGERIVSGVVEQIIIIVYFYDFILADARNTGEVPSAYRGRDRIGVDAMETVSDKIFSVMARRLSSGVGTRERRIGGDEELTRSASGIEDSRGRAHGGKRA